MMHGPSDKAITEREMGVNVQRHRIPHRQNNPHKEGSI
jgi:hypothetical protein